MMATALQVIDNNLCNPEAEVIVLSATLCDRLMIDQLADKLPAEDFSEPIFGQIYSLIVHEHSLGHAATPVTLRPFLEGLPAFQDMGGFAWLAGLTGQSFSRFHAQGAADQIVSFARRRRLIEGLRETIRKAGSHDEPIEALIEEADDAINSAREGKKADFEHSAAQCVEAVINSFSEPVTGVECGNIPSVDQLLGPMRPTHLIIGAGRPGMGKTATAVSYALGAASRGHGVLFMSLEMGADELGERMAADLCFEERVPHRAIRDHTLTRDQQRSICRAHERLKAMPLQIIDQGGITVGQLRAKARRWARRFEARGHKLELIIVDYLQLMRADRKMDRFEAVSEISRSLKELAKELKVAVFALSQLSRAVEQRPDKRPILSDLRESGQIEQDADAVLFFLRDEYYLRLMDPPSDDEKRAKFEAALKKSEGRIEFICAKRRNGEARSLKGEFFYHYQAVRG